MYRSAVADTIAAMRPTTSAVSAATASLPPRLLAALFAALFAALLAAACSRQSPAPELRQIGGPTMGSAWSLKWHGGPATPIVQRTVEDELAATDATFSNWRDDSELARLRASDPAQPFAASARLREALQLALQLARCTDGAYDPTVKPLVDLFRRSKQTGTPPDAQALAAARARVGHDRVRIEGEVIVRASAAVDLDLDGVVAGLCADRIAARLEALGVRDFLLDVTGEILVRGQKPGGVPWRVGIVDPERATAGDEAAILDFPLQERALCTSDDYRNFAVVGGEVVTHVFDPRTGENPRHGVVSVSVLAKSCGLADGLGTALMVLGPERAAAALASCGEEDVGAWFVLASPDGSLRGEGVGWPEAFSLLGRPLHRPALDADALAARQAALREAEQRLAAAPDDVEAAIWVGRRLGYLSRCRDAIATYTAALERHPDDPRLLRHRGHRFLSVRDLEAAERDLARAAELVRGTTDATEPDGLPAPGRPPHSTLQFNVHYHLGLARFCRADYAGAERAWRDCLATVQNDEARVAVTHWLWCALTRQGRSGEAKPLLAAIPADPDVVENTAYLRLCRLYRGDLALGDFTFGPSLDAATAFGLANHLLAQRDTGQATAWLRDVAARPDWPSFGVLAAEATLLALPGR